MYVARRWSEHGYFGDAGLRWPGWRYGAIAWFLPGVLTFVVFLISLPLYRLDLSAGLAVLGQVAISLTLAVPIIAAISFGEEFGWRSYLLPRLMALLGPWKGTVGPGCNLGFLARAVDSAAWRQLQLRSSIINAVAASERNCHLALDDQHLISAPAIHSAGVAFLHRRRPENLHVGIGSRYDPPLPLLARPVD